jgi:hypothetical protein
MPGRHVIPNVHAGRLKFYFAAVGSGAGFSDSEFK